MRARLIFFCALLVFGGCSGDSDEGPTPFSPVINNLTIQPELICVGDIAKVRFTVIDPNQDMITWTASLSTTIHGELDQTTGNEPSGVSVSIAFRAATSGRHRHNVTLKVTASDAGGLQAEPLEVDFFVFNC